jgi:Uma2 family endonuclease
MAMPQYEDRYSWQDYLAGSEGERLELIGGVPYAMSPAPRREHQRVVGVLTHLLYQALSDEPCGVYPAPFDVKLSANEADDAPTVVQPDLTVVCDESLLTEQGVSGAPELNIEVVAPDTGYHDRARKFDLYQRYGVREYWILDHTERVLEVYLLSFHEGEPRAAGGGAAGEAESAGHGAGEGEGAGAGKGAGEGEGAGAETARTTSPRYQRLGAFGPENHVTSVTIPAVRIDLSQVFPDGGAAGAS